MTKALKEICGGGTLNCRFPHVYTDGPAPYYTYAGLYRAGSADDQDAAIKQAASDAIMAAGGTITQELNEGCQSQRFLACVMFHAECHQEFANP